jgi:endonuclease/exonuclease/phosphatase (EEP) superfamily protein YafD
LRKSLAIRARVWLTLSAICALLGYTGSWHWLAGLFAHFFIQYWSVSLLALLILLWAGDRRWSGAAAVVFGVLSFAVAPFYLQPTGVSAATPGSSLKLFQFNAAQDPERVFAWMEQNPDRADVVALLEATPDFQPGIERLRKSFPHVATRLQRGPFGIALLSKYPLAASEVFYPVGENYPALAAKVSIAPHSEPLSLYVVHPPPPVSRELADLRDRFMAVLARRLVVPGNTLLVGDLNSTPWAPGLRDFIDVTGLRDCQRGHGLIATWPAVTARYSPLLGIPIDACLASDRLYVAARQVGPDLGSDHLPIVTEFDMR